tara:strand:- start:5123 stop:6055 length:933 start_codon:yes stop_codon:yes gene_type:complete
MEKKKVLITWSFFSNHINIFKKQFENKNISYKVLLDRQAISEKKLLKIIAPYHGIICGDDEITSKVIDRAKNLKVISKWGTGIDSIDSEYAKKRGIKVCNVPTAFTGEVAIYAVTIVLALLRNLISSYNSNINGKWEKFTGQSISGKTLGVVGFGKIGKKICSYSKKLGFKILINDRSIKQKKTAKTLGYIYANIKKIYKESDVIVFAADLNKTSYNLFNFNSLRYLKKKPILVNIARGPIVSELALIKAMKQGKISAFGLDVYENEPLKKSSKLLQFKNCFLSSHNAFNTEQSIKRCNQKVFENLVKYI